MKLINFEDKKPKEPSNATIRDHLKDMLEASERQGIADYECYNITFMMECPEKGGLLNFSCPGAVDMTTLGWWTTCTSVIQDMCVSHEVLDEDE